MTTTVLSQAQLIEALRDQGFKILPSCDSAHFLAGGIDQQHWASFADSWNALEVDPYLANAGKYRRRRHGVFKIEGGKISQAPHRAHFQSLHYNHLYGGLQRWYLPLAPAIANSPTLLRILQWCHETFTALQPNVPAWDVEVHQFRIEAKDDALGQPTPEGMHRDGVDFVLVLLIARHQVTSGTTMIGDGQGGSFGSFTLTEPLDAVMLDDRRVYHGVTAIAPVAANTPAYRDVLVVTFRAN